MAFNLPHEMSLQHLTELQEAGTRYATAAAAAPLQARTSDANTAQAAEAVENSEERGLRQHMIQSKQAASAQDEAGGAAALSSEGDKIDGNDRDTKIEKGGPTWLNNAVLRQATAAAATANYSQWLPMAGGHTQIVQASETTAAAATTTGELDTPKAQQQSHGSGEMNHSTGHAKGFLDLHADTANSGGDLVEEDGVDAKMWQTARLKADIVTHPLYEQLLSAHISCLRTATPVDQLQKIDAQVGHSHQVAAKYAILAGDQGLTSKDKDEVNEFMAHYVTLLRSFKEQLQQHVRVHAMEAVVACWELEQSLFTLTGVSPGQGTGATMSDDEDDQADSDSGYYDTGLDSHDFTGFGPLIPTETERTLMERVRHELKIELKQGYKAKINDVREEILRKRRAGKLPGDTTSVLKSWWHAHSKWPYPSEDDKARLVQETGLELKQINNWFINQRKRNWHSNPSSSSSLKNKRKR